MKNELDPIIERVLFEVYDSGKIIIKWDMIKSRKQDKRLPSNVKTYDMNIYFAGKKFTCKAGNLEDTELHYQEKQTIKKLIDELKKYNTVRVKKWLNKIVVKKN